MSDVIDVRAAGRAVGVDRALAALRAGEVVVLPTDTVYGVGVDAFDPAATARLFRAKQRDRSVPLPVMVRSPKQLTGFTPVVPVAAERLMAAFWPGALTLVVPAEPGLQWDLGDTDGTVAVRMPLDDVALALIRALGPLAVTSANLSGRPPAHSVTEAQEQLGGAVAVYLDDGPRTGGVPSTIVDLTRPAPQVLRVGALDSDLVLGVAAGHIDPVDAAARLEAEG